MNTRKTDCNVFSGEVNMINTLYKIFQPWSEGGSIYIISDTHFGDPDCKFMDEGWITPDDQVAIINRFARQNDTLIHLGDVGDTDYIERLVARRKILILGNHDAPGKCKEVFDEVYSGPLFISDKILLSHEPVHGLTWCLNIHGHDHGNVEGYLEGCPHLNLAANVCNYTPVNLGRLIKKGVLSNIPNIHRQTINARAAM